MINKDCFRKSINKKQIKISLKMLVLESFKNKDLDQVSKNVDEIEFKNKNEENEIKLSQFKIVFLFYLNLICEQNIISINIKDFLEDLEFAYYRNSILNEMLLRNRERDQQLVFLRNLFEDFFNNLQLYPQSRFRNNIHF